ncbi:MAG: NrdH-redoxin [Halopseudomonas yangmingensis]|mgnify:CR=1 FL=1
MSRLMSSLRWLWLLMMLWSLAAPAAELEVFVRDGCPHCSEVKKQLPQLLAERPWLVVRLTQVDRDPQALQRFLQLSEQAGVWPPGVPAFAFDGRFLVGFDERQGLQQLRLLTDSGVPHSDSLGVGPLGELSVERLGLPLFTLAVGLLDGFNPCAMWVLLFLLSILVHLRDRLRMALIAGTFVLASGAIYFLFMVAWLNLFLLVGVTFWLQWLLALLALLVGLINLKSFVQPQSAVKLAIPDAAKPGIYARVRGIVQSRSLPLALLGCAVLAVLVNMVELLCTAGLPALYTAILSARELEPLQHYGYLGLYILGYIFDDALMVGAAVWLMSSRKLGEQGGRWLKLLSAVVMLGLGLVMMLRPQWLF